MSMFKLMVLKKLMHIMADIVVLNLGPSIVRIAFV